MQQKLSMDTQLARVRERLVDLDFLQGKGLSNEVNLHIFPYPPQDELKVRDFVGRIVQEFNNNPSLPSVAHFDLYDLLLEICQERRVLDRVPEQEQKKGREFMLNQLRKLASPEAYIQLMRRVEVKSGDMVLITGAGRVYPYMRSHSILNNLQHVFGNVPVVLFYPGSYDGQTLRLFNLFMDDHYYRAFNLI